MLFVLLSRPLGLDPIACVPQNASRCMSMFGCPPTLPERLLRPSHYKFNVHPVYLLSFALFHIAPPEANHAPLQPLCHNQSQPCEFSIVIHRTHIGSGVDITTPQMHGEDQLDSLQQAPACTHHTIPVVKQDGVRPHSRRVQFPHNTIPVVKQDGVRPHSPRPVLPQYVPVVKQDGVRLHSRRVQFPQIIAWLPLRHCLSGLGHFHRVHAHGLHLCIWWSLWRKFQARCLFGRRHCEEIRMEGCCHLRGLPDCRSNLLWPRLWSDALACPQLAASCSFRCVASSTCRVLAHFHVLLCCPERGILQHGCWQEPVLRLRHPFCCDCRRLRRFPVATDIDVSSAGLGFGWCLPHTIAEC